MFLPIELRDGYLPIEDHGLLGDGFASALVGRDGTIDWLCVPRFDSQPLFASLLDRDRGGGMRIVARNQPDLELRLDSSAELQGLRSTLHLRAGEEAHLVLRWGGVPHTRRLVAAQDLVRQTTDAWRSWLSRLDYGGRQEALVRRSAITLKMLDYLPTGAIVAAATSSLPEWIGGHRNWDHRYAWVRDVAFSVYALRRIGMEHELYESLCGRANQVGLLAEQVEPETGAFLGNFPQGFSHIGVISSGMNLARLGRR